MILLGSFSPLNGTDSSLRVPSLSLIKQICFLKKPVGFGFKAVHSEAFLENLYCVLECVCKARF